MEGRPLPLLPPAAVRAINEAASAASQRASLRVIGAGVAGRLSHDDANANAHNNAIRRVVNPAVLQPVRQRPASLAEHIGKLPAVPERPTDKPRKHASSSIACDSLKRLKMLPNDRRCGRWRRPDRPGEPLRRKANDTRP